MILSRHDSVSILWLDDGDEGSAEPIREISSIRGQNQERLRRTSNIEHRTLNLELNIAANPNGDVAITEGWETFNIQPEKCTAARRQ